MPPDAPAPIAILDALSLARHLWATLPGVTYAERMQFERGVESCVAAVRAHAIPPNERTSDAPMSAKREAR